MGSRIKNLLTKDWIVVCNAGSDYNDFVLGLKTRQVGVLLKRVFFTSLSGTGLFLKIHRIKLMESFFVILTHMLFVVLQF